MNIIKHLGLICFTFILTLFANTQIKAQNLSFSIERSSGNFAIYDGGKNVTALYELQLAEFDIYSQENKYMGTIQVNTKTNKINPADLQAKEHLKVSKVQLLDKNTNSTINIDSKKSYQVNMK